MYFAENPGKIEVVPWYANNEIFLQEVRFSVPASEWNKFLNSDLYRELESYVDSLGTQDTHTDNHERGCTAEIEPTWRNSNAPVFRESFSVRVRTWIIRKLCY